MQHLNVNRNYFLFLPYLLNFKSIHIYSYFKGTVTCCSRERVAITSNSFLFYPIREDASKSHPPPSRFKILEYIHSDHIVFNGRKLAMTFLKPGFSNIILFSILSVFFLRRVIRILIHVFSFGKNYLLVAQVFLRY